ncbi:hypothetical protein ELE36_19055 [Pseudolysobacter antarcticus]|uniref:Uncharacterized protein n=1 Tax=Pseudolysobacter antarcticus TaxID=2511995 RepID=A0A411HP63_9GAMM|nr:hypothetical protein [Pseudolysobacter antarcticus]QBB72298.1 hypothetical protein ELE36_19055 [Pseudolysobacter antarcticus]
MFIPSATLRGVAAFALLALSGAAVASSVTPSAAFSAAQVSAQAEAVATNHALVQRLLANPERTLGGVSTQGIAPGTRQNNSTDEVSASSYRAYPPSCLSNPLPTTTSGPVYSAQVPLAAYNGTQYIIETATISVWRVACPSLTGQAASATLMRIQRAAELTTQYPLFPDIRMAQTSSGVGFDDLTYRDYIRLAREPNTILEGEPTNISVFNSTTYVLEYYPDASYNVQNFNNSFSLRFDNLFGQSTSKTFINNIPAYAPTAATYPAAFQPMPVSGFQSGNYVTTLNNENMLIQIYQSPVVADSATKRYLLFTWVAYAADGTALNLEGNTVFNIGAQSVTSPVVLVGNNGVQSGIWGNVTFSFSDCNTAQFTYTNTSGLPGPSGSGTRTWNRLFSLYLNGLVCQ